MSVEQRKVIDAIGISKADGHAILTICDHLLFTGDAARLQVLQDKLNDYLDFIASGEIYDTYPAANGKLLEISIIFKHIPDAAATVFLAAAQQTVAEAEIALTYKVSP